MDASITAALISGAGVIITAWFGFAGHRKGSLATAEKDFRDTVLADNERLRKRVDELEAKLAQNMLKSQELEVRLARIRSPQNGEEETANVVVLDGGIPS